ncbi:hypothetical protein SUGI_0301530 [Cryptomeria japonica]|nr:hypothetical protein SUGI_0301530 [Cryptomeria japonica]
MCRINKAGSSCVPRLRRSKTRVIIASAAAFPRTRECRMSGVVPRRLRGFPFVRVYGYICWRLFFLPRIRRSNPALAPHRGLAKRLQNLILAPKKCIVFNCYKRRW